MSARALSVLWLSLAAGCMALPESGSPTGRGASPLTGSAPRIAAAPGPAAAQDYAPFDPFGAEYRDMRLATEVGTRRWQNGAWGNLDTPSVLGLSGSQEPPGWLLGLDGGLLYTWDSGTLNGTDTSLTTGEAYGGAMKSVALLRGRLVLLAGAGAAVHYLEADPDDPLLEHDRAYWTAGYARAGVLLHVSDGFELGVMARGERGPGFDVLGAHLDGDYEQLAFVLGASW